MKTHCLVPALFTLLFAAGGIFGQSINTWKGGAPGRATDWNCPANWQKNRVPDEFDRVVVPDVRTRGEYFPVVRAEVSPIAAILLESGARLTIKDGGRLVVATDDAWNDIVVLGEISALGRGFFGFQTVPAELAEVIRITKR